ncbi:glycosyltransferase family 4 protein [Paracoccus pacificus]|uniref:Glycosyltransferase family 4 protein n=1 Tax=Paracoccus pacificus TaxID=1463598 RepID=A0ABW4R4A5_9RHOB
MVGHGVNLGGIERHVVALSAALRGAGHQVAFAGPLDGWLGRAMAAEGLECQHLPMRGMYDYRSAWKLRRFARTWRADILHGHAMRGTRYALMAKTARMPVVATAHSTNASSRLRHDHPIITVSDAVREFLIGKGFPAEHIVSVYLGVGDLGLAAAPSPAGIGADRPLTLGMLSRLEPVKGHDIALEAVHLLQNDLPLRLVIIGPDNTDWARQMKAKTIELGLQDRVEFKGEASDLRGVFDGIDLMLAPSRREALSLSLIEAGAAGRPSIGARIGGIPEVIEDGRSGLLVPPEDPPALAEAIQRLGRDDALRQRMGQAAREVYEARFTEEVMVRRTEAIYEQAIRNRQARG